MQGRYRSSKMVHIRKPQLLVMFSCNSRKVNRRSDVTGNDINVYVF